MEAIKKNQVSVNTSAKMTTEENNLLRELLEKKIAEYESGINVVIDHCEADDMEYEIQEETRYLRSALRDAWEFAYHLRETDDNYAELTLEHIREEE